jgi:hypothetical protein
MIVRGMMKLIKEFAKLAEKRQPANPEAHMLS